MIDAVLLNERVRTARAHIERSDEATLGRQAALSAIPAPTGAEGARGARVAEMFGDAGLDEITIDAVGNVRGWCGGGSGERGSQRTSRYRVRSRTGCVGGAARAAARGSRHRGQRARSGCARRDWRGARPGG